MEYNIDAIDKRLQMRFDVENSDALVLEDNDEIKSVIDISRGGMSVAHDDTLKVGDIVPVHIKYGDIEINADVEIVSATKHRAGAKFINLDDATANQLLYMSLMLEQNHDQENVKYTMGTPQLSAEKTIFE